MTADDEAGAAPQRRASKSLAHTGSSEAKGGKPPPLTAKDNPQAYEFLFLPAALQRLPGSGTTDGKDGDDDVWNRRSATTIET